MSKTRRSFGVEQKADVVRRYWSERAELPTAVFQSRLRDRVGDARNRAETWERHRLPFMLFRL